MSTLQAITRVEVVSHPYDGHTYWRVICAQHGEYVHSNEGWEVRLLSEDPGLFCDGAHR